MSGPWLRPRPQIAVLYGGDSPERSISLESGRAVAAALREAHYGVRLIDPAGQPLADVSWSDIDACFLALHGGAGEDGRVQRRLELLRVSYTGSGPAASRLAMSKSASKERFLQAGVPTLPYLLFHADEPIDDLTGRLGALAFPLVVKPDAMGSSLGVSLVRTGADLSAAVAAAARYEDFLLAEPFVPGRELTVAVLGREALPVLEVLAANALFDYEAKYHDPQTQYCFELDLGHETLAAVEQAAIAAAEALGTRGLVRVDLILDRQHRPWVLEVNTSPGMTPSSLAPKAAARGGLSLAALCDWIVRDCLAAETVS